MLAARKPAVIYADGIGDHFLMLPALRALAQLFPQRLVLLGHDYLSRLLFSDVPFGSSVQRNDEKPEESARLVQGCDFLITADPDPESVFSTELIKRLNPRWSLGWSAAHRVLLPFTDEHHSDLVFRAPRYLNHSLRIEDFAGPPPLPGRSVADAREIRAKARGKRVLAFHGDTMAQKTWPTYQLARFLRLFRRAHPEFLVFLVGCKSILGEGWEVENGMIPCYGLDLTTSIALVAQCDLFLGVDSSMLHAADIFRVPSVGLFGGTSHQRWGFRFTSHCHVISERMSGIQPEIVLEELEQLIRSESAVGLKCGGLEPVAEVRRRRS